MNYTQQGQKAHNKWSYWVLCLGILGLFGVNATQSSEPFTANHLGENTTLALMLLPFIFFLLGLFLVVKWVNKMSLVAFTSHRGKIDYQRIAFGFAVWGGITILGTLTDYWLHPTNYQWNYSADNFWNLIVILAIFLPFQVGFEEYFFRGYVWHFLGIIRLNKWSICLVSSLFFTLVHASNPEVTQLGYLSMFIYGIMALMLGIIVLADNGLEIAIGVHLANNFLSGIMVSAQWSVFQTPSLFKYLGHYNIGATDILLQAGFCMLALFIFKQKYQWKLFSKN